MFLFHLYITAMRIAILDSYLTDLLVLMSSCFINILVEGEVTMAKGDIYDIRKYQWQLRGTADDNVFIRYDESVNSENKGRYNTSAIVSVKNQNDAIICTTKSGSVYLLDKSKCAFPMHLLNLTMRFGIEF